MPLPDLRNGRAQVREIAEWVRCGEGAVHLVGVAGIGMAGVAVHLADRGFEVSGCDLLSNRVSGWLRDRGIPVFESHAAGHVEPPVQWVVRSTAVSDACPDLVRAVERDLPVYHRGLVLPALLMDRISVAVSGTHGKTTTSNMITQILVQAGKNPGFCIGGEVDALGGVANPGGGEILVVEADESDGTVMLYEPDIAVITNVEYDHMEHFGNEDALFQCFESFSRNARKRVIYCADDARTVRICSTLSGSRSYGFQEEASVRGMNYADSAEGSTFDVMADRVSLGTLELPVPGYHNAVNALGACAAAFELGVKFSEVRRALASFCHARRRFEKMADGNIKVISDYAHHPTEIRALTRTVSNLPHRRLIAVFQPHRYTRTRALGMDFPAAFDGVDELVLTPVYAASEAPLEGGMSKDLLAHFKAADTAFPVRLTDSLAAARKYLESVLKRGDVLLIVGAGDIEELAEWAGARYSDERNMG